MRKLNVGLPLVARKKRCGCTEYFGLK